MLRSRFVSMWFFKCGHQIGKQPFDQKVRVHPSPEPFSFECWCCWCLTRFETKAHTHTQTDCVVHSFHSEGKRSGIFWFVLWMLLLSLAIPSMKRKDNVSCLAEITRPKVAPMSYFKKTNKNTAFTDPNISSRGYWHPLLIWLSIHYSLQHGM